MSGSILQSGTVFSRIFSGARPLSALGPASCSLARARTRPWPSRGAGSRRDGPSRVAAFTRAPPFRGVNEYFLSRQRYLRAVQDDIDHARADHAPGFTQIQTRLAMNGPLWTRAHPERATWRRRKLARGGRGSTALLTRSSLVRKFCARGCGRVHRWHDERLGSRGDR